MQHLTSWDINEELFVPIIDGVNKKIEAVSGNDASIEFVGYITSDPGFIILVSGLESIDQRYIQQCIRIFKSFGANHVTPSINFDDREISFSVYINPNKYTMRYKRFQPLLISAFLYIVLIWWKPERYSMW